MQSRAEEKTFEDEYGSGIEVIEVFGWMVGMVQLVGGAYDGWMRSGERGGKENKENVCVRGEQERYLDTTSMFR